MKNHLGKLTTLVAATLLIATSAHADLYTVGSTVNVTVHGVSPKETVRINSSTLGNVNVYAGLVDLTIGGIGNVDALCIDPFQWANSGSFKVANLGDAPVTREMGAAAASLVSKLWALNYEDAKTNSHKAAGLQIAVWEVVGGAGFSFLNDYLNNVDLGSIANAMITEATNYQGPGAKLVALTNREKQDFVVQQVPDGGTTVLLLGLGLGGLAFFRRRL